MKDSKSRVTVKEHLCKRCGICIAFCPQHVFVAAKDGLPLVIDEAACTSCRLCDWRCPDLAITLEVIESA